MNHWLLWPPGAFLIILATALLLLRGMSLLACRPGGAAEAGGKRKAYACGEDVATGRIQPDYSQFFPFAFFFTIMHVLALVTATVPFHDWPAVEIGAGYLLCLLVGLIVLFRR